MKNNKKGPAVKGADLNVPAEDYQYIENTEGAAKMGYTQNFGPARKGGYAKGAAKVNSIMGKGPAQDGEGSILSPEDRARLLNLSRSGDTASERRLHSERGTAGVVDSLKIDQKNPALAIKKYGKNFTGLHSQMKNLSSETIAGLDTYIASGDVDTDLQNIIDTEKEKKKPAVKLQPKF
jgi:hypothetical protein